MAQTITEKIAEKYGVTPSTTIAGTLKKISGDETGDVNIASLVGKMEAGGGGGKGIVYYVADGEYATADKYDCVINSDVKTFSSRAFMANVTLLKSLEIKEGVQDLSFISSIGGSDIEELVVPKSCTYLPSCSSAAKLKRLILKNGTKKDTYAIAGGCSSLEYVFIGSGVHLSMNADFSGDEKLNTVVFEEPISFSTLTSIFSGCKGLVNINLPVGITTLASGAFYGCSMLQHLDLPEGLTTIEGGAFNNCSHPDFDLVIPSTVTSINSGAFDAKVVGTIKCKFSEGAVSDAPWGATKATIIYDYEG